MDKLLVALSFVYFLYWALIWYKDWKIKKDSSWIPAVISAILCVLFGALIFVMVFI